MTYKVRILETADRELSEIVAYLYACGEHTAKAFLDEYEKQLGLISKGSVSYSLSRMPELAELGYHTALAGHYLFLYYIEDDTVVVAHLFHQTQNYAAMVAPR